MPMLEVLDATLTRETVHVLPAKVGDEQGLALTAGEQARNRQCWQDFIDDVLVEWGRDPSQLEDDDVVPPTVATIEVAARFAMELRNAGVAPPMRVVPTGDGGIVFERWEGRVSERVEICDDGSIEYTAYDDCRLAARKRLR